MKINSTLSGTQLDGRRRARRRNIPGLIFLFNLYVARRQPVSLVHFVTEQCNARCPHCFIDFEHAPRPDQVLRLDEIAALVDTLGPALFAVYLTGGEPFLRDDLKEVAAIYARKRGLRSLFITTNGFFTDRIMELAENYRRGNYAPELFITISIDDLEQDHDARRGVKGLFGRALDSYRRLEALNDSQVHANIALTVTPANADRAESIYRTLRDDYGVRSVTAIAMRAQGVVQPLAPEVREAVWRGYDRLSKAILDDWQRDAAAGYRKGFLAHLINGKNRLFYSMLRDIYVESRYCSSCPAGALFGVIRANGDVYPCEVLDRKLGNLREYAMDFSALWRARPAQDCHRWIRDHRCHCSYECAWSVNILSHWRYLPRFGYGALRSYLRNGRRHA